MSNLVSIIVPAYNEQDSLPVFIPALVAALKNEKSYEIIIINDGSTDQTAEVVLNFRKKNPCIHLISFSRNFGAQAALCAGYQKARGTCVISLDADLQHPVEMIPEMLKKWREGYDVIYAIRKQSNHLKRFKRISAAIFYRIFKWITGMDKNIGADFRLMSRAAVDALNQFSETTPFLRGLVSQIGFRQCPMYYDEKTRQYGGASRYTLKKMFNLALTGILSFSIKPLHLIALFGGTMTIVGVLSLLITVIFSVFTSYHVSDTSILLLALTIFSGIQLSALGIIGEYVGNITNTVKKRPLYLISKNTLEKECSHESK